MVRDDAVTLESIQKACESIWNITGNITGNQYVFPVGDSGVPRLNGLEVFTSPYVPCVMDKEVRRTWKERLFSLPWKPWKSIKVIRKEGMIISLPGGSLLMHPRTLEDLKRAIANTP